MKEWIATEWAYLTATVRDYIAPIIYWRERKARRERFAQIALSDRWKGVINED